MTQKEIIADLQQKISDLSRRVAMLESERTYRYQYPYYPQRPYYTYPYGPIWTSNSSDITFSTGDTTK